MKRTFQNDFSQPTRESLPEEQLFAGQTEYQNESPSVRMFLLMLLLILSAKRFIHTLVVVFWKEKKKLNCFSFLTVLCVSECAPVKLYMRVIKLKKVVRKKKWYKSVLKALLFYLYISNLITLFIVILQRTIISILRSVVVRQHGW